MTTMEYEGQLPVGRIDALGRNPWPGATSVPGVVSKYAQQIWIRASSGRLALIAVSSCLPNNKVTPKGTKHTSVRRVPRVLPIGWPGTTSKLMCFKRYSIRCSAAFHSRTLLHCYRHHKENTVGRVPIPGVAGVAGVECNNLSVSV